MEDGSGTRLYPDLKIFSVLAANDYIRFLVLKCEYGEMRFR